MTDKTRIKIAATVTALFLAAISAVGLAAQTDKPQTPAASAKAPIAANTPTGAQAPRSAPAAQATTYEDEGYDNEEREDDD